MNTAIIVAAGQGTRFAGSTPKQFLELSGKPVIYHTLERFDRCNAIDAIVIVLPADDFQDWGDIVAMANCTKLKTLVPGGSTRAESVQRGFEAVEEAGNGVIAVHDGARPLVSSGEIESTVERASQIGAACLVADLTDTIKYIEGDFIAGTVDRQSLRRALTPQAFQHEIFRKMMALGLSDNTVTDECFLAERLGIPIAAVSGSSRNIKITHPTDLRLAEILLAELRSGYGA